MTIKSVLLYILAAFALCAVAQTQTQTALLMGPLEDYSTSFSGFPLAPPVSIGPKTAEAPLFTYGLDERVRTEDWDNAFDMNNRSAGPGDEDDHEQLRIRTRLWAGLSTPHSEVQLNVRLVNEMYKMISVNQRLNDNEVVFDALNLQVNKTYIPGISLSIGRQEWVKNDGFLFMDGSSGDGSRTMYMNMLDLAYTHKKSLLEVVGILDPRMDRFFPAIHDQYKYQNEWDEQAAGIYYTDRNHKNTDIDAFYMLKKEINDYRAPTNSLFQPNKHVNTIGGRIDQRLPNGISIKGEAALQFDELHANPAQSLAATSYTALGSYATLTKQFLNVKGKPYIMGGYTVLTGSNKQADGAGFDPLFSRWPKYSELYVYTQVDEKGVAYATNDRIVTAVVGFNPLKAVTLRTKFEQHNAFDSINHFNPTVFGTGLNRGGNFQERGDIVLNKNWKGFILWERWLPGTFYAHQDASYFFQAQVTYSFQDRIFGPSNHN
jgi:hypothetical protein